MANLLTRKDVAELIGKEPNYIGMNIKRGKLIEKDKKIDTDNTKNKLFIAKFLKKGVLEKDKEERIKSESNDIEAVETAVKKQGKVNEGNIDYVVRQHDLKLKALKIQREELDFEKKQGGLIRVDESKQIMQIVVDNLRIYCSQEFKLSLIQLCANEDISDEQQMKILKMFAIAMNEGSEQARTAIKKDVESAAKQFSKTKNIGESN